MYNQSQQTGRILPKKLITLALNFVDNLANFFVNLKITPNALSVYALGLGFGAGILFAFSQPYLLRNGTAGKWPQRAQGTRSGISRRIAAITRSNLSDSIYYPTRLYSGQHNRKVFRAREIKLRSMRANFNFTDFLIIVYLISIDGAYNIISIDRHYLIVHYSSLAKGRTEFNHLNYVDYILLNCR